MLLSTYYCNKMINMVENITISSCYFFFKPNQYQYMYFKINLEAYIF